MSCVGHGILVKQHSKSEPSIELPATSRNCRDITETLLKVT